MEYLKYLEELIPEKDSLKIVRAEAENFYKTHSLDECFHMGHELYQSDNFQIRRWVFSCLDMRHIKIRMPCHS